MTAVEERPATSTTAAGLPARGRLRYAVVLAVLTVILIGSMTAGIAFGSVNVPPGQVLAVLAHHLHPGLADLPEEQFVETIVLDSRAPRVLLGALVGAGLALVGMTMQALVRNPLADPYLLGVSSGASVGAVAVIVTGTHLAGGISISAAAFLGALGALLLVYSMARCGGQITTTRLVLAGVAVAYVLSALTSLLLLLAPRADQAREVLSWLLGGLGGTHWDALWLPAFVLLAGMVALLAQARSLNVLLAGDDAALSMGVDVHRFRTRMFVLASLITGVLVAVSGPIGFVGLILPHAVRILVGADHRRALPAAALAGAGFLVLADLVARTVASPREIPVGVLTALCGGPFFLWLIRRDARRAAAHAT